MSQTHSTLPATFSLWEVFVAHILVAVGATILSVILYNLIAANTNIPPEVNMVLSVGTFALSFGILEWDFNSRRKNREGVVAWKALFKGGIALLVASMHHVFTQTHPFLVDIIILVTILFFIGDEWDDSSTKHGGF